MGKIIQRAILPVLLCLSFLSIKSVYATFQFAGLPPDPGQTDLRLDIITFEYKPEEVLPGGGTGGGESGEGGTTAPLGENHLKLITNLVDEKDYGLNATKKPVIHELLDNPGDIVYSDQNVTGGNLKHIMPSFSSETEKLYFVITKISDTEYHAFTFTASDRLLPIGTDIAVYKTIMRKDGKGVWAATSSYKGYAKVNAPGIVSRAIDVSTWRDELY